MELIKVLKSPIVTEKSTKAQASRKYMFLVHLDANKNEIRDAVEKFYGVTVEKINIVPVLKKARLVGRGRSITKRPLGRKAIVTLAEKQSIDFNKIKIS